MSRFVVSLLCLLVVALSSGVASCSRHNDSEKVFSVRGIIRGPFEDGTISIEHEAIPNYMPAMTMPFYVDAADVNGLTPGDKVEFEFRVGDTSRATKFRKVGSVALSTEREGSSSAEFAQPAIRRLREGDPVPAFSLIDQDNRPFTADALRGRHTIVTFVFTRCPVPEFCPLIGKKYQAMQALLRAATDAPTSETQLVSITIDPEHDRPEILRSYGQSLGADFARWRFLTGDREEIAKLTRLFAVRTERNNGNLDHTLATALIGPRGEIMEIWRGNAWSPEEIVPKLRGGGN